MRNKGFQARTRPRRPHHDRTAFTAASVLRMLRKEAGGNTMTEDDPVLASVAAKLNTLQTWVRLNEVSWNDSKINRNRLAEALRTIDQVLPFLRKEIMEARKYHVADGGHLQAQAAHQAIWVIDNLARAVAATGDCAILLHPSLRHIIHFEWERFADDLMTICSTDLSGFSREAHYRFITEAIPAITGETATVSAVKTRLVKRNSSNGANDLAIRTRCG